MNIISGQEHFNRVQFITDHMLLSSGDIEYLFEMEYNINPGNFRRYIKVAYCAKENELEQLKADRLTFSKLYTKCAKRKNTVSAAFSDAKKLIMKYKNLKREIQTGIHPQSFTDQELRALKKAVEIFGLQELVKNL